MPGGGAAPFRQRAQRNAALGAERVVRGLVAAVGAGDVRADRTLGALLPQPELEHQPQPDERDHVEHEEHGEPRADRQPSSRRRGGDEQPGAQCERGHRMPEPAERVAVPGRRAVAQPQRPAGGAGRRHREDREREPDREQPPDPGHNRPAGGETVLKELVAADDDLGRGQGRGGGGTERDAVQDVIEAAVGEEHERRAGDREDQLQDRQQHDRHERARPVAGGRLGEVGCAERMAEQRDHDPGGGAPGERERDHQRRLFLVDVDVVQVQRREYRNERGGAGESEREQPGDPERNDDRRPDSHRDPIVGHVRAREMGEQR